MPPTRRHGSDWSGRPRRIADSSAATGTRAPTTTSWSPPRSRRRTVQRFLDGGFGADGQPDLMGVVLRGPVGSLDRTTHRIVDTVRARVPDATFAITATGSGTPMAGAVPADTVARQLEDSLHAPLVTAAAPGGLFLDEERVATSGIGADAVATALLERSAPGGEALFTDAYPAYAVALARYC